MATQETVKIYRIEIPGIESAISKIQQLNLELEHQKSIKREADKVFAASRVEYTNAANQQKLLTDAISRQKIVIKEAATTWKDFIKDKLELYTKEIGYKAALEKLSKEWKDYKINIKNAGDEIVRMEKLVQEFAITERKAGEAMEVSRKTIAQSEIAQRKLNAEKRISQKETDILIKVAEKEAKMNLESSNAARHAAGSYNFLYAEKKRLENLLRATSPSDPLFDKIKRDALEATKRVHDFNRELSPDGTLVGEYRRGILNAFKDLGLDDVIKKEKLTIEKQINDLILRNKELVAEYKRAGTQGADAFNKIETELKQNLDMQQRLEGSLKNINATLGGVGSSVGSTIAAGFKDARTQLNQLVLGYIGFQAAIGTGRKLISVNFDFEDTAQQLKAITGVAGKDFEFLKKQALETSSSTRFSAVEILESFKLIASAKPELLKDVDALNLIKDATVLLAQASGTALPEAAIAITDSLNQFGASADQARHFVDALAAGAKFGAKEIPFITTALLDFGAQAKSSNVSIEESIALIELLGERGQKAGEAGTKIRNILLVLNAAASLDKVAQQSLRNAGVDFDILNDKTLSLEVRLKELGKIQNDENAILQVFGKENFNAAQIVLTSIPRYAQLAAQTKTLGVAQEQAADQTATASNRWKIFTNQLSNLVTSKQVVGFLSGIATILSFLVGNLGLTIPLILTTIALTNTWTGTLVRLTASYSLQLAAWVIERAQLIVTNGIRAASTVLINVYTAATIRSTAATGAAAIGFRILAGAIAFITSPLGIVVGLLVAFTTVVGIFSSSAKSAASGIGDLNRVMKINHQVQLEALKATSDQRAEVTLLAAATKDMSISEGTRLAAMQKLIAIDPSFQNALKDGKINYEALNLSLDKYNRNLIRSAELEASRGRQQREFAKLTELSTQKQDLEFAIATKNIDSLDDELKKKLFEAASTRLNPFPSDVEVKKAGQQMIAQLEVQIKDQSKVIDAATQVFLDKQKKVDDAAAKSNFGKFIGGLVKEPKKPIEESGSSNTIDSLKVQLANVDKEIVQLDSLKTKTTDQLLRVKSLRLQKKELQKQIKELGGGTVAGGSEFRGSRLSGDTKDELKEIDATAGEAIAKENQRVNEIQKLRKLTFDQEREHLQAITKINIDALNQKIAIFERKKKLNAEEAQTLAEFKEQKSSIELETSTKIREINEREFEERQVILKNQLAEEIAFIEDRNRRLQEDPATSQTSKAQAQVEADKAVLALFVKFSDDIDVLEKKLGVNSLKNVKENAENVRRERQRIITDDKKLIEAQLKDAADAAAVSIDKIKIQAANKTIAALSSNKSSFAIAQEVAKIQKDAARLIEINQLALAKIELDILKKGVDDKLKTEKEYQDKLAEYKEKEAKLIKTTVEEEKTAFQQFIGTLRDLGQQLKESLLGIKNYSKDAEGEAAKRKDANIDAANSINQAITEATENFFRAQSDQIDKARDVAQQRLDLEKEQVIAKAQSQQEIESIEQQFAEKKKIIDKKAGEEKRQLALKQLSIDYAVSVVKALAQYGFPLALIPIAGATALYFVQRSNIQKQSFERGGSFNEVLGRGGVFRGQSHREGGNKFWYKGMPVETEADEAYVINKKATQSSKVLTVTGTIKQIASAINQEGGGRSFAAGAIIKRKIDDVYKYRYLEYGGALGTNLNAPVDPGSFLNPNNQASAIATNEHLNQLMDMIAVTNTNVNQVANTVKNLEVTQTTKSVQDALNKKVKNDAISTL